MGYFRNEIRNIQQASNLSHDFLYSFLFFQLLWEEVQGVPATARPPEGVPGPHEPEMTVLVGGAWDEARSLWHNSDDKSRTRRLNLAAFFSINNVFLIPLWGFNILIWYYVIYAGLIRWHMASDLCVKLCVSNSGWMGQVAVKVKHHGVLSSNAFLINISNEHSCLCHSSLMCLDKQAYVLPVSVQWHSFLNCLSFVLSSLDFIPPLPVFNTSLVLKFSCLLLTEGKPVAIVPLDKSW